MGICPRNNKKYIIVAVSCFCFIILTVSFQHHYNNVRIMRNGNNDVIIETKSPKNILDGCYHVYIDVGTNIGVQIRKLFEPEKFPKAYVHSIFNSKFGNSTERLKSTPDGGHMVCAIGFEPNPHHTTYLKEVESSYTKCGWNVKIMTETAASDRNGLTTFYSDESYRNMEWGGGILPPNINNVAVNREINTENQELQDVRLIRLSEFLQNTVATRRIPINPHSSISPNVVMKMDIEGSEVDIIPDLLFTGGFQFINNIMVEWHERLEKLYSRRKAQQQLRLIIKTMSEYSETMNQNGAKFDFNLVNLDDETYYTFKPDFPKCNLL